MKQFKKTIVAGITAGILSLSMIASGDLLAYGKGHRGGGMGRGWNNGQAQTQNVRPGRILRDELRQAKVEVLSEMSGQTVDELNGILAYKPLWAVLDEYKVDFSEFREKMHETHVALVEKAAADGKITETEKTQVLEQMALNQSQQGSFGSRGFGKGSGHRSPHGSKHHGMGWGFGNGRQMPNNGDRNDTEDGNKSP